MISRQKPTHPNSESDDNNQKPNIIRNGILIILIISLALILTQITNNQDENRPEITEDNNENSHETASCSSGKNCWSNPTDCPCADDEYCSENTRQCVKPDCGNGICEIYESRETCCPDCGCLLPGTYCNEDTKKCQDYEMRLSDKEALEIARAYFEEHGIDPTGAKIGRVSSYNGELIKIVNLPTNPSIDSYISIGITEEGEIIEIR